MEDIHKLINDILSQTKVANIINSKTEEIHEYSSEPLIKIASEMKSSLPYKYKEMRKIRDSYSGLYYTYDVKQFYEQGLFMADFEDDYEYTGIYSEYFPTYQSMNDRQLRGYFSWRTKVRKGIIEKTSLSFAFVYIYEILNNIGVLSPIDGFEKLTAFFISYKEFEPEIMNYKMHWLKDYVIYYNLDYELLSSYEYYNSSKKLEIILDAKKCSPSDLVSALNYFSSYNITKSKFYKNFNDDINAVIYKVYIELDDYYDKHRKNSIFNKIFGNLGAYPYNIFGSAVFNRAINPDNREYIVSPIDKYYCKNGYWQHYNCSDVTKRNKLIGEILKTIDKKMREIYRFPYSLTVKLNSKIINNIIDRSVNDYCTVNSRISYYLKFKKEEKREDIRDKIVDIPKPVEIIIDSTKFDDIRKIADIVQQKLIVDEENEIVFEKVAYEACDTILNSDEKEIAKAILENNVEKVNIITKAKGLMLSVVVEKINEKLFDLINDNCLEMYDDVPYIIEDYINDVKEAINK